MSATPVDANRFLVRPYRPADRQAVRDICVATCWMGEYRPEMIPDDWLWAEYWTRYFTDREPDCTWVAQDPDGKVTGYITGTADVRRFERFVPFLLPRMVLHVVRRRLIRRRDSRRAILSMLGAVLRGELDVPERTKNAFPATFHFDLLPHARGAGLGGRLFRLFVRRMQALGVPGIHGQVLSLNRPVQEFLHRVGCRMVAARPTGAYQHIVREPVEVQTWVLPL